jgi:hypothetical protein
MASTHKSLRSSTANKRPTTAIADGQIALNTNATSPGLFFKDSAGTVIIKIGPVHVGTTAPNVSPGAGGSTGNSTGEAWLDTSLTPNGWKVWTGAAWLNATPAGSDTVQGLLELATNAETQTGSDTARAVTPAGLQSKVSDSTSTTSSTTIASSTAVKSAYDLANAALPKSGGTVTGNLEIGTTGSLTFEGATADAFETTLAVVDPTADRTITLPNVTGTVVTTGDAGTVTSTMILDGTILNADVNASAAIAGTKISPDFGSQTITTTGVFSHAPGAVATPSITFTGDLNTGIYSPGADHLAVATNGTQRLTVDTAATTSTLPVVHPLGAFGTPSITFTGDLNTGFWSPSADALAASTAGGERLRITSAGLVGIGTSSPATYLSIAAPATDPTGLESSAAFSINSNGSSKFQFGVGTVTMGYGAWIQNSVGNTNYPLSLQPRGGNVGIGTTNPQAPLHVVGTSGIRISDPTNAVLNIRGDSGANSYLYFAESSVADRGIIGYPAGSGDLVYRSGGNSFSSGNERFRCDSSGRLLVGTTSNNLANEYALFARSFGPNSNSTAFADQQTPLSVYGNFGGGGNDQICSSALTVYGWSSGATSPGAIMRGWWSTNGANLGTPTLRYQVAFNGNVTNSNNSYGALSDVRYKQDIVEAGSQWDDIKSIVIKKFRLIDDVQNETEEKPAPYQLGCIAQEVIEVSPGLVEVRGDDKNDNGDVIPDVLTIKYSVLYMKSVKALQEAMERIEQLEQRLTDAGIA